MTREGKRGSGEEVNHQIFLRFREVQQKKSFNSRRGFFSFSEIRSRYPTNSFLYLFIDIYIFKTSFFSFWPAFTFDFSTSSGILVLLRNIFQEGANPGTTNFFFRRKTLLRSREQKNNNPWEIDYSFCYGYSKRKIT